MIKAICFITCLTFIGCNSQTSKNETIANSIDSNTAYEFSKLISEPPDKVFNALIDAPTLKKIWGATSITVDARPGGKTLAVLKINDEDWNFNLTYKEVVMNEKLQWVVRFDKLPDKEITTTISLKKAKGGTDLTLRQENFADPKERDENRKGWEMALIKLEALISWH